MNLTKYGGGVDSCKPRERIEYPLKVSQRPVLSVGGVGGWITAASLRIMLTGACIVMARDSMQVATSVMLVKEQGSSKSGR
jgi:hypothetical protein